MTSTELAAVRPRRYWLPQIRLITLLLLTACAAVWCGVWLAEREAFKLESQLMITRQLSRELVIKDRTMLSIIRQDELFYDENIWQVYVPREGMKIHAVTQGIDLNTAIPPPAEISAIIHPGQHTIELKVEQRGDQWLVVVQVDMENVIQLTKDRAWNSSGGSSGGGMFDRQTDFKEGPAIMFRRRFNSQVNGQTQAHPDGNGVILWIE